MINAIVSFLISALSGMGVGGGGLFMIYLALFTDIPQIVCQGINLLFFLFAGGASLIIHMLKRRLFSVTLFLLLFALVGAMGGIFLSDLVNGDILRKMFGVMLVISGIYSLKRFFSQKKESKDEK